MFINQCIFIIQIIICKTNKQKKNEKSSKEASFRGIHRGTAVHVVRRGGTGGKEHDSRSYGVKPSCKPLPYSTSRKCAETPPLPHRNVE